MFFSKESFEQLCPSYQKAVLNFEKEYSSVSGNGRTTIIVKKKDLIYKFSNTYLTPKEIWDEFFKLHNEIVDKEYIRTRESNVMHFYFNDHRDYFKSLKKRMFRFQDFPTLFTGIYPDNQIRPRFTYPHLELKREYRLLAEFAANPISKEENQRYQFMLDLCEKIKAVENEDDDEKWFNLLLEANNIHFLAASVEYRLGKNLNNLKLWKLYIEFCKTLKSKKALIDLYSKYCRYFLDDEITKKEYKNAVKKRSWLFLKRHPVNWENPFKFEKCVKILDWYKPLHAEKNLPPFFRKTPENWINKKLKIVTPNFKKYRNQIFPLSKPIMVYLLQNQNPALLHKFHKCCKYFFIVRPFPVCHRFHGGAPFAPWQQPVMFNGLSLQIRDVKCIAPYTHNSFDKTDVFPNSIHEFKNRIIISNSFSINSRNPLFLTYIVKNVFQCNAKFCDIFHQNFSFQELKILIGNGNTEYLNLQNVKIYDSIGNLTPMEEILRFLPKIIEFRISNPIITAETPRELSKMKFHNSIEQFFISGKYTELQAIEFLAFLRKTFEPFFHVNLNSVNQYSGLKKYEFKLITKLKEHQKTIL